MKKAIMQTD